MREGAYDFVEKPLKRMTIVKSVRKAAEKQKLVAENKSLRQELKLLTTREIVGSSPAWRRVIDVATQAAPSVATVLVLGESGTGKELLARYHPRAKRSAQRGPFVAVNCAAIPETILESELFGHERGAFTGAIAAPRRALREGRGRHALPRRDRRALAAGAGEAPARPPGGRVRAASAATPTRADVRIVAATNRDLLAEVQAGRFREDLYYRLNVIAVTAPPLRARREDIPLLVDHFLGLYCAKNGKARLAPTRGAMLERMLDYALAGQRARARERHRARRRPLARRHARRAGPARRHRARRRAPKRGARSRSRSARTLDEIELRVIRETLRHTKGDKTLAAQLLGISTRTIYRKLDGVPEEG